MALRKSGSRAKGSSSFGTQNWDSVVDDDDDYYHDY